VIVTERTAHAVAAAHQPPAKTGRPTLGLIAHASADRRPGGFVECDWDETMEADRRDAPLYAEAANDWGPFGQDAKPFATAS
jgi:hypothetical protein